MIPIQHRLRVASAPIFQALHQFECDLRVAIPAIVVSFDPAKQTVSVQPAIQEVIREQALPVIKTIDILDDVAVCFPRAGGWSLTLPIQPGDECLLVFADMAYDHWHENGGVQKQPDGKLYRHDIGDAIAIFGISSLPRALDNYSTNSAQLRSDDGSVVVDLAPAAATITAPEVNIVSPAVTIASSGGTPQALVNSAWLMWFTTNIMPFLTGLGYSGPSMPAVSETAVLQAE